MLKFDPVQRYIDLNEAVFLQYVDGTIYKCTETDTSIMHEQLLIWSGSFKWYSFAHIKHKLSLVEDQGAAQAMWELVND